MSSTTERPLPRTMRRGVQASAFMGDPRINRHQMVAIEAACRADSEARVLGLDRKLRPVVRARTGIPRSVRTWALLRNGDPTTPDGLLEEWR